VIDAAFLVFEEDDVLLHSVSHFAESPNRRIAESLNRAVTPQRAAFQLIKTQPTG
jgi:hypothetical protein